MSDEDEIKNGAYLHVIGVPPQPFADSSAHIGISIHNEYGNNDLGLNPYAPNPQYSVYLTNTKNSIDYPTGINVWLKNFYTGYEGGGGFGRCYMVYVRNWDSVDPFIKSVVRKYVICPKCLNKTRYNYIWPRQEYTCSHCRTTFTRFNMKE